MQKPQFSGLFKILSFIKGLQAILLTDKRPFMAEETKKVNDSQEFKNRLR
jgi:hypothetical protein